MKKKKVLVTFCEAGQGHIVTAEAIAESLERKYSNQIEVERKYVFRDSPIKALQKYEQFAINDVQRANKNKMHLRFQMLAMKIFGEQSSLNFVFSTVFGKVKKGLIEYYASENPDAIVSTYFATHHIACVAKKKGKITSQVIAYNPDHNTHGWWDRGGDMFITNNPYATQEAIEKRHIDSSKVKTVNFITRSSVVNANESKEFYRKKYNLPLDKFTVVLADGAYAKAKLDCFTKELLKTDLPITIIPICGKNQQLLDEYNQLKSSVKPNITFLPQPFVPSLPEICCASDLYITKAGPNAITDCVFMHTPIMTNFYSGNIEEASNKLFTEVYKMGFYCPDKVEAKKKVEEFILNPSLLDEYRQNTYKIDKNNNGADEIADLIAQSLGIEKSTIS